MDYDVYRLDLIILFAIVVPSVPQIVLTVFVIIHPPLCLPVIIGYDHGHIDQQEAVFSI